MPSEAGTCRTYVLPAIYAAGWIWIDDQIREQLTFTPGRIIVAGGKVKRGKSKRLDYLLSYKRDRRGGEGRGSLAWWRAVEGWIPRKRPRTRPA
jgi:hypothetical protein